MTRLPDTRDDALARTSPARGGTESSIAGRLADATRAPPDLGTFVGRFEVIRLLGRGGFGVVYEARDTELGRHVALKLMRTDRLGATDRESLLEMFRGEAEAAAKLTAAEAVLDTGGAGEERYDRRRRVGLLMSMFPGPRKR